MPAGLERLEAIQPLLTAYGVADSITYDLGETCGMAYYTGITFRGYAPGLGFSICSGGRYDDLVGHFGPAQPAVGCALWLDRMLLARQRQGGRPRRVRPDLLIAADGCDQQLRLARSFAETVCESSWTLVAARAKSCPDVLTSGTSGASPPAPAMVTLFCWKMV